MRNHQKLLKMIQLALLTAIVIVFQMLGSFIKITPGTSISLVLIPIVIGSVLTGPTGGGFLGFVFGAITLWAGVSGTDGFTHILFSSQPIATTLICLGKGTLAGVGAGWLYRLVVGDGTRLSRKVAGAFAASAAVPIINTGLFILGGLTLVSGTLSTNFVGEGTTLVYFLVIGCAGLNFIFEFLLNMIVAPAINTIVFAVQKNMGKKDYR